MHDKSEQSCRRRRNASVITTPRAAAASPHHTFVTTCHSRNPMVATATSPPSHVKNLKQIKSEVYEGFSHVFSAVSSQEEVYERMVKPLVEDFINGKSGMLAALGPSGSGKTHTVFGCPREPGMVPLALQQIFKRTEGSGSEAIRSFYISIFEIYSEQGKGERMLDLSPGGADLFMQQSSIKGLQELRMWLRGIMGIPITSSPRIATILQMISAED